MNFFVRVKIEFPIPQGFNHNVESTQNVIFICTEEMKKVVFDDGILSLNEFDANNQTATANTIKTFKNFMKVYFRQSTLQTLVRRVTKTDQHCIKPIRIRAL